MPSVLVRNLSEEAHRCLKARAASHGRSTEAEIRSILEEATLAKERYRLGSSLAAIGKRAGGVSIEPNRDPDDIEPARFE